MTYEDADDELGVNELAAVAQRVLGDRTVPFVFGYRVRVGVRESLERDVAVLAPRARLALRQRRLERVDQHRPRPPRLDHVVDVAALGGRPRVREALLVVGDQLGAARLGIVGVLELLAEDDVDRALRAPSPRPRPSATRS